MNTGELKHRISLYIVTQITDGEGGFTSTEALASTRYAKVRQLSQSESTTSGQVVGENNFSITLRRPENEILSRSLLLVWNNRRMNITGIETDDFWHYITATEKS